MEGGGDDKSSLRVASFSYYLDTAKDNSMLHKAHQEIPILLSSNTNKNSFSYLNNTSSAAAGLTFPQPTRRQDGEIGVFGAHTFFTMKHNHLKNAEFNVAGAAQSQAGSYNSRTALLPIIESQPKQQKKGINGRRTFLGFGCQGPCFDKKGVHINQVVLVESIRSQRLIDSGTQSHRVVKQQQEEEEVDQTNVLEESRKSIEVFGSGAAALKGEVAKNMERKLSMLTWDAIPKPDHENNSIPTSRGDDVDDVASDASSDLFEIENISSGAVHPMIMTSADDDDDASISICISPAASHYAPSEASIQWSVATASALDYNDDASVYVAGDLMPRTNTGKPRHAAGILGCRSKKSVDVALNVVTSKNQEKAKHQELSISSGKSLKY